MFVDTAKIYVKGGDGGRGSNAMRREKYIAAGGPWGGHGGRGGDVVFVVDGGLHTLLDFKYQRHFKAPKGEPGGPKRQTGRVGGNLVVKVPPGTVIKDADSAQVLCDLVRLGQQAVVARGGRGGRGNTAFVSSVNRAPRLWEEGEPGEERWVLLELKVMADVGLVGWPNAGKSSLLARISAARPKIGNYPFTTLEPVLGVVEVDDQTFTVGDIPGLIEGAHAGVGLGHDFLRHVERTRVLICMVDGAGTDARDPANDLAVVRRELELHQPRLAQKPYVVAVNKMDLPAARENFPAIAGALADPQTPVFAISAATGEGIQDLLRAAARILAKVPDREAETDGEPILYRPEDPQAFRVERQGAGWSVTGRSIERLVAMTPWQNEDAVARFQRIFRRSGIETALRRSGARDGDTIAIRDVEFELQPEEAPGRPLRRQR